MNERGMRLRFICCGGVMFLALLCLCMRLVHLHILTDAHARETIVANRTFTAKLDVARGKICDRNGDASILAMDIVGRDICADPSALVSNSLIQAVAASLAKDLDLDADRIERKLSVPGSRYARIAMKVHPDLAAKVEAREIKGVFFEKSNVRYYPHGDFLCHVLGFVNYNGDGSAGVEQKMDVFLRGCPGILESRKNALREELYTQRGRYIPSMEGANISLTIDQFVQCRVEDVLDEVVAEHNAKGAWAIVQRVRTGEIVAMASRPSYDLNMFTASDANARLNRAIGYTFEPGSTFKAIVFAAALEEGRVYPDTKIDCEYGMWMHAGRPLRDYHPYGILSVADGLKKSSNILSAKLELMLGDRLFYSYMRAFGIGQRSGLDLPGEEAGILHPVRNWSKVSGSRMCIGQGVAVTAMQMLGVYSAIANDGVLMKPYVVAEVHAKDGTMLHVGKPEPLSRPVSSRNAALMRQLLARVTEKGGTGRRARVEGYTVAGKTGTAQKAIKGGYSSVNHIASFVGFLPAESPELSIIVVVDDPQPIHTGGRVAGPAFSKIAEYAVRRMDVPASNHFKLAGR